MTGPKDRDIGRMGDEYFVDFGWARAIDAGGTFLRLATYTGTSIRQGGV